MNISRKVVLPALGITIIGGGLALGLTQVHAQTSTPFSGLVQFLAQKFNLDQTKVQDAVNEYHTQQKQTMLQNMQAKLDTYLTGLVTQGKITNDQKTAIESEIKSLQSKYGPGTQQNLTPEQRRTNMQTMQTEWQNWLKSQNLDQSVIGPVFGWGRGPKMGMGRGMRDLDD